MMALAEAIRERGGEALAPLAYKKMYLDRLWNKIRTRIEDLRTGAAPPERYLVPGALKLLEELARRGLTLYLASGTDDANVKEEASLLGVSSYFGNRIYGAKDDLNSFSKAALVRQILSETAESGQEPLAADELLVFGDGFVEIEEVSTVGGTAVGVASAEPECQKVDTWKRERLIRAGADFIVPNYLDMEELVDTVFCSPVLNK